MSISTYEKDGKQFFRVYVQGRGKVDTSVRVQKNTFRIETFKEACKEEKRLIKVVTEEINKREGRGLKWRDILERWELCVRHGKLGEQKDIHYTQAHGGD